MKAGVAQIVLHRDINSNVEKISFYVEQARELKLDILCFPECSLTGYMRDFSAISNGEIETALSSIHRQAIENNLNVIMGTPYWENDMLFNAAAVLLTNNKRLIYCKNNLTDFDKQYFSSGQDRLMFEVNGVGCGVLICRDQNYPLLAQEYARSAVRIIFFLSAHYYPPHEARLKVEKNRALPIARAVENRLFVAKANAVGSQDNRISLGHSMIVNPEGLIVREADEEQEQLLHHEI